MTKVGQRDYVFVDIATKGARPSPKDESDDRFVDEGMQSKLVSKSSGPFKVIGFSDQTVTMLENGLENTVSVDRVVREGRAQATPQVVPTAQMTLSSLIGQDQDGTPLLATTNTRGTPPLPHTGNIPCRLEPKT